MTDAVAQGIVLGLVLAVLAIIVTLGRKLWANQSEGARRLKLVLKIGAALAVAAVLLTSGKNGPFVLVTLVVVIGVVYWVVKGFKKG